MLKNGVLFVFFLLIPIGIIGETINKNTVNLLPSNFEHVELSLTTNRTLILTGFSDNQLMLYVLENDDYDSWLNQNTFTQVHSQFINQSFEIQLDPEVKTNYRLHFVFVNFNDQDVVLTYEITVDEISTDKLGIETWLSFLSFTLLAISIRRRKITSAQ